MTLGGLPLVPTDTFGLHKTSDTADIPLKVVYTRKNATDLLQPVAPSGLIQI